MELANLKWGLSSLKGSMDGLGQLVKQSDPDEHDFSTFSIKELRDEIETDLEPQILATKADLKRRGYEVNYDQTNVSQTHAIQPHR